MIDKGDLAPDFRLASSEGGELALSDLRGSKVVLYFYPKDDTPGCTTEACGFRDNMARLTSAGVEVIGVSKDSLASHQKFKVKYELPFPLLSDPDNAVASEYGAFGEKKMYGKTVTGTIRSTFLIDEQGKVAERWRNVQVKGHVDKVLAAIEALG